MRTPSDASHGVLVPSVYPALLLHLAKERGVDSAALLRRCNVNASVDDVASGGLPMPLFARLSSTVAELLGDEVAGVEMGWNLPLTVLGSVGQAVLSSSTIREALDTLQRFWSLLGLGVVLTVDEHQGLVHLEASTTEYVSAPLRSMELELTRAGLVQVLVSLAPRTSAHNIVWFDFAAPTHATLVRQRLGTVRYAMPVTKLSFPQRCLETPLPMASSIAHRRAMQACLREEHEHASTTLNEVARVTAHLKPIPTGYPSLQEVARRMGMSPRTVRRRLREHGTSFQALLNQVRRRDALRLLDNAALSIGEVASSLGYESPASFTRAFTRWTQHTPSDYRRRSRNAEPGK